jgi:hypothetical protein
MDYSGGFCCLLVVGLVGLSVVMYTLRRRSYRWGIDDRASVVCIHCQGSGWTQRRERTLSFTGDGFADEERPATMCPACGGTGTVVR